MTTKREAAKKQTNKKKNPKNKRTLVDRDEEVKNLFTIAKIIPYK